MRARPGKEQRSPEVENQESYPDEVVWIAAQLGAAPEEWTSLVAVSRTLPGYDLLSALQALQSVEGRTASAFFSQGARSPVHLHEEVGSRLLGQPNGQGQPNGLVSIEGIDSTVAFQAGPGPAVARIERDPQVPDQARLTTYARDPETGRAAQEILWASVRGPSSTWRRRMLAFDPGPSGLVRPLDLPANRVGLAKQVEDVLRRTVVVPLSDRQSDASATTPGALLITGPPASGKSAAVAWLASQLEGVATTLVLHPRVLSSADFLHLAFDMAADATPSLLVLDNLDLILGDRFSMRYPESLAELATRLDDLLGYRQVVVVATAVQAEPLDALLHARFPNRLQLGEAPKSQRIEMLKALVERHGGDGAIIEVLARRTQHWRVGKIADLARLADATAAAGGSVDLVHLVDQVQKPVLAQDSDDSDGTYL